MIGVALGRPKRLSRLNPPVAKGTPPVEDKSYFWPLLRSFRSAEGWDITEVERRRLVGLGFPAEEVAALMAQRRWALSPKCEPNLSHLMTLIGAFCAREEPFHYLEFGACFATTFAAVLKSFPNARGHALEMDPYRFRVCQHVLCSLDDAWRIRGRYTLENVGLYDWKLPDRPLDVIFMDTNHTPEDRDYVRYLLDRGMLSPRGVFFIDDANHTGTKAALVPLAEELPRDFGRKLIVREDWDLAWFF